MTEAPLGGITGWLLIWAAADDHGDDLVELDRKIEENFVVHFCMKSDYMWILHKSRET